MEDSKLIAGLSGLLVLTGLFDLFSGSLLLGAAQIGAAAYAGKKVLFK